MNYANMIEEKNLKVSADNISLQRQRTHAYIDRAERFHRCNSNLHYSRHLYNFYEST